MLDLLKEDEEEVKKIKREKRKSAMNATRDKSRERDASPLSPSYTRRKSQIATPTKKPFLQDDTFNRSSLPNETDEVFKRAKTINP